MSLLKTVILDWAGTTVDFGSQAPVRTIQTVFARRSMEVSEALARRHMGLAKRDHIRELLSIARPDSTGPTADALYQEFIPLQLEILAEHSLLIPGVHEAVQRMRKRGLKIGATTGYTREMLDLLAERAREQGYVPDVSLSPEDVGAGRPHPFMIFEIAVRTMTYPLSAFVKVGDTPADIEEGLNAGVWTVGVAATGNMIGLCGNVEAARRELERAQAHFVIDSVAEIDPVLDEIEKRLAGGQLPR